MKRREKWAWIATIEGMYYQKINKLLNHFKSINSIYEADEKLLIQCGGIERKEASEIVRSKEDFDAKAFFEKLDRLRINFVTVEDKEYPQKLLPYSHKPYFLFYKGKLPQNNLPAVAMIGARGCSRYGRSTAQKIAAELSMSGVQIISGMARGIDTYSTLGALESGGSAFAVLGCGADICYPSENIEIYNNICQNGGIISEYPPGTKPLAWHFPQRNRIISGLADKVIVVEAKEKSGSLITVEWALEQGKDIMAVPGRVDEKLSDGCNRLIKSGAGIVTSSKDVLDELDCALFNSRNKICVEEKALEKDLALLYSELSLQPKNICELMDKTGIKYEILLEMMLQLQLMGLAEQTSDNYYLKVEI